MFRFPPNKVVTRQSADKPWVTDEVKPQSHRAYDQLTTSLRPTSDRHMLESSENRRKNVRLVAEPVGDRQGKISRSKVVVMFKTPKAPAKPGLRPGYDLPSTETCWNRGQIVKRTYDWSQRSCDCSQMSWMIQHF